MGAFEQREEGFEKAHALDEERRFKTIARRNRSLGLWAAEQLGLAGAEASAYADALVAAQVGEADDEALARSLAAALASVNADVSAHRLRRKIDEATALAAKQIADGR
jgi:hypothetical protein